MPDRKGQRCRITARGALNSIRVEFLSGAEQPPLIQMNLTPDSGGDPSPPRGGSPNPRDPS